MPRIYVSLTLAALTLLPACASAAPADTLPRDVPPGHYAAGSVKRVLHEKILGREQDDRFQGNKPVTRYELAVALDRFVRYIESARKPLHAEIVSPTVTVPTEATPVQRTALIHLVSNGFLPLNSPLTQNGGKPVTAKELSDALAFVTIKLSDRAEPPQKLP